MMYNLPDVQETMEPIINSPIKQVGVENIMLNFSLELDLIYNKKELFIYHQRLRLKQIWVPQKKVFQCQGYS